MKQIILILLFITFSQSAAQMPLGEFRTVRFDSNRDTIISNRQYGDWWYGIKGGASGSMYFGELNLLQFPTEINNPFNSLIKYNSGSGFGYFFGLVGEWLPTQKYWGALLGINFFDRRVFDTQAIPLNDSLNTRFEVDGKTTLLNINASARYNFGIPGLHAIAGLDFDILIDDKLRQRKKFINTGDILQDQIVPIKEATTGFGMHIGVGYDVFDGDIIDWGRIMLTPFISLHVTTTSIGDNNTKWNTYYAKAGLSLKFGKDRIVRDTLKYDPLYVPPPQYIASVRDNRGIGFSQYIPAEQLPAATLALVDNPVLLGELRPAELKETERPRVVDLTTLENPVAIELGQTKPFSFPTSASTNLNAETRQYLDAVANFLLANPNTEVRIVGHSDNQGTLSENTERSRARANNARQYLIARGVPPGRVLATFSGALFPIASNETEAGRRQNRRIEIVISPR